jgi:probable DNA repair protein
MEPDSLLPDDLARVLARGGTIVTVNQRAARTLRLAYDGQRRAVGLASWQPPSILAWENWTAALWRQLLLEGDSAAAPDRLLLNQSQELQLWRSVISADISSAPQSSSLQSAGSLAAMAAAAWRLLCAYRGQPRLRNLGVSGDTRSFQRWAQAFLRRCNADRYLSAAELESALAAALAASSFRHSSGELLLIGFDNLTPAQAALIESLRDAGVRIAEPDASPLATHCYLAEAETLDEELHNAALWLRSALEANPAARIAVIHPEIAAERGALDRAFGRALAPELQDIAADRGRSPFEFSLGEALVRQPMVALAITLLHWTISPLPVGEISGILLSPFFTPVAERDIRAEFDAFHLSQTHLLRPEFGLPALIEVAEGSRAAGRLGGLLRQLRELHRTAARLLAGGSPRQRSFADWADAIRELLRAAGWAASVSLDSTAFQTLRKWDSALDELATLDFEGTRPTFAEALGHLEEIVGRTLFAPESREAPIQIMSPLEAAGSRFDAVYFLRCSDLSWPVRPGLSPLLGWRVQRDLRMPGSDAAEDAASARRVAARLAASAPTVVFSYARQTADARQRPSAALSWVALEPLGPQSLRPLDPPIALETVEDPGYIPLADPRVRGGSAILKLQAACGFRAFAEARLWSTAVDAPGPGMDAAERGSIVHRALQELWAELGTQAALRALTAGQRSAALDRAIDLSLGRFQADAVSDWDAAYIELQRERLQRLLMPWLELELSRPPFEVVLREQKLEDLAIGPLRIDLRVDRVDRIVGEDGENLGEVILDYKTGTSGPKMWESDRPEEPQLPLYAALREPGSVAGVAFASLRAGNDLGLRGLASRDDILPKHAGQTAPTLDEQIAQWRAVLTNLAIDFADGDARVRPKRYPETCAFCQQRLLCRLDPATLEALAEDTEDADA